MLHATKWHTKSPKLRRPLRCCTRDLTHLPPLFERKRMKEIGRARLTIDRANWMAAKPRYISTGSWTNCRNPKINKEPAHTARSDRGTGAIAGVGAGAGAGARGQFPFFVAAKKSVKIKISAWMARATTRKQLRKQMNGRNGSARNTRARRTNIALGWLHLEIESICSRSWKFDETTHNTQYDYCQDTDEQPGKSTGIGIAVQTQIFQSKVFYIFLSWRRNI